MKIKDNLDLQGYLLQNFCVDNYDSLDGISNKGDGRMVFLTGNSTDAKYRHVNVWDGTNFKALAYLEDVAMNDDFIALQEKVDSIDEMLNLESSQTVIDTWEEVKAFLDSVPEGLELMDLLNDKLSKSQGGTINGNLLIGAPDNTSYRYLQFARSGYGSRINVADGDLYVSFGGIDANGGLTATKVFSFGNNGIRYASDGKTYHDILTSAGGTITNSDNFKLTLNATNADNYNLLGFASNGAVNAYIGTKGDAFHISSVYTGFYFNDKTLIHSGNYSDYALPLTGGTIKATSVRALTINRNNGINSFIFFKGLIDNAEADLGYLGFNGVNSPIFYSVEGSTYDLLHAGNVGEYALKIDGSNAMTGTLRLKGSYLSFLSRDGSKEYGAYNVNASNNMPIYLYNDAWKTLAFTDSDITGYATGLKHSNGTVGATVVSSGRVDFSGNISLALGKSILDPSGRSAFAIDGNNSPQIGLDTCGSYSTYINGKDVYLRYGSSRTAGLILNSSGNVTIGASDLAGTDYKLFVHGVGVAFGTTDDCRIDFQRAGINKFRAVNAGGCFSWRVNGVDNDVMLINSSGKVLIGLNSTYDSSFIFNSSGNAGFGGSVFTGCGNEYGVYMGGTDWGAYLHVHSKGTWKSSNIALRPNGDVLIATTEDNGSGAKLQVNGGISASIISLYETSSKTRLTQLTQGGIGRIYVYDETENIDKDLWLGRTGALVVKGNGNVGIGTTDPVQPLDVNGNILIPNYSALMSRKVDGTGINLIYAGNDDIINIGGGILPIKLQGNTTIAGDLHVTGNIIADGEVSAGGAGEEGSTSGSGAGAFHSESIAVGATQTTIAHGLGTDDIVVSIYEKDATSGLWSMILTDIEITDANNIRVTFGSATTVEHKVVIMGAVA